ncbi:MAG: hypothetical protein KF699_09200 [Phycisphaeraceae bacterium]|nr:hypothetical protein [Phycisphaeraceae bacterium]
MRARTIAMSLPLVLAACASPEAAPVRSPWITRAGVAAHGYAPPGANLPPPAAAALLPVELGAVPYDGITLPLVSPDARFVATQTGGLPDWDVLLAAPGAVAAAALRNTVEVHALPATGRPVARLPAGFLLGRSAVEQGFLVEVPGQTGDSRRIGLAPWAARGTADIVFLTPDAPGSCAAFGVLGPRGELAYCLRERADGPFVLRIRTDALDARSERECAMPGASLLFPLFEDDANPRALYALAAPHPREPRLPLLLVRIDLDAPGERLNVGAAAPIAQNSGLFEAFQCIAAAQSPSPALSVGAASRRGGVLLFSPGEQTTVWARQGRDDTLRALAVHPGLLTSIWGDEVAEGGPCIVSSTAADLVVQMTGGDSAGRQTTFGPPRLIRPGISIPRRTGTAAMPYILLRTSGPEAGKFLFLTGLRSPTQ